MLLASVQRLAARWQRACTEFFFARFFALLLAVVSLAQWACGAWLSSSLGWPLPLPLQLVGPLAVYTVNRKLIGTMRGQRDGRGWRFSCLRAYAAVAFTSLFCAAFLAASATAWGGLRLALGALTVEAGTLQAAAASSTIDGIFHWVSAAGVSTIAAAFAYGYTIGQRRLSLTHMRLPLAYAPALHGLRIAHISDLHIGQNLSQPRLRKFVQRINALRPDLICITGDIADGVSADLPVYLPLLGELRARFGVFAILGNHDHYAGADRVEAGLRQYTAFTVLRDALAVVDIAGVRLHVVGLDDIGRDWARGVHRHAGLARLQARLPTGEPVLLLCHRPEAFSHAAALGIPLTLAGHTHGGQLALPWFDGRRHGLSRFITPFDQGVYQKDGCYLYVTRGLGVTGQRIRLFATREITLIEVAAESRAAA
ncbi:MAG: metallophosphoesterase [Deltaproteobacteria bacterium]|nr:metallophosphoesterase [Deltaproteobacteria bacterium]